MIDNIVNKYLTEEHKHKKVASNITKSIDTALNTLQWDEPIHTQWNNDDSIEHGQYNPNDGETFLMNILKGKRVMAELQVYVKKNKISGWMPTNGTSQYKPIAKAIDTIIGKKV